MMAHRENLRKVHPQSGWAGSVVLSPCHGTSVNPGHNVSHYCWRREKWASLVASSVEAEDPAEHPTLPRPANAARTFWLECHWCRG